MDFNTIYEAVKPYLGTGAIAGAIVTILGLVVKVLGFIKESKSLFESTQNEAINAFKKALPKELYISIETLAKTELNKITESIVSIVNDKVLGQIKANTELVQAIASALVTMRNIPDSAKVKIAELLEIKEVETTESLKVELLTIDEKTEKKEDKTLLID